jgi:DNA-binding MarR family transcriptional regulator
MPTDPRKLKDQPGIRIAVDIHRVHRALLAHAAAFAETVELEVALLSAVHSLGLWGPVTMGRLAQLIVVDAPDMTRRAKQLEAKGLVTRRRSPTSQREVPIELTPQGKALFARSFTQLHAEHAASFDAHLSRKEQQQQLSRLLARLQA